jgi:alpha-glucosidase (family GH31 glycosyl hydrolase)
VSLNEHPHDGIRPSEDCYADFMRELGYDPEKKESLLFDASNRDYMNAFLKHSRAENRSYGIDFYWLDWQQNYLYPYVRGSHMTHIQWLNKLYYEDLERDNRRGASYSRWGGWGDHRYPINFSGDATGNWDVLAFEIKLSQTSGNAGCYFWVHDTGGFHGKHDPELHVRWSQFCSLTAALRVHASRGPKLDRRPWLWGEQATGAMHTAYDFHAEAMPYIYSSVHETHATMLPLNRCMFVDYPTDSNAYGRYNQYLFGDLLLAAPITSHGSGDDFTASQTVWFPADADWWDYFTDEVHTAGTIATVTKDIYTFPLFVKGGYILPMQPYANHPASAPLSTLVMRVYPGKSGDNNTFTLYEDDGESLDYRNGGYAETALTYQQSDNNVTITVAPTVGSYTGQLNKRAYQLVLAGFHNICNIKVAGKKAKSIINGTRCIVDIPSQSIRKATTITFECDTTSLH